MLRILTETEGVSGDEKRVAELICDCVKEYCDSTEFDVMNNLICRKKGKIGKTTVLLSAHTDEVGFIVTDITDDGYLRFESVGGIDTKILLSQRVRCGDVRGVISLKAIHLTKKEERSAEPCENELYVDVGVTSREEAEKIVNKGSYFTFDSEYKEQGDLIKAKALDDRAGCALLIEMLKREWNCNLICLFAGCEEIGHLGAIGAMRKIKADYALVIEGTTCNDLIGVVDDKRVTKFGGGIALSVMDYGSVANEELLNKVISVADKNSVKWQYKASVRGGNDARVISVSNGGLKTVSLSFPCKYIHSPVSAMNRNDYKAGIELVSKFLESAEEI